MICLGIWGFGDLLLFFVILFSFRLGLWEFLHDCLGFWDLGIFS